MLYVERDQNGAIIALRRGESVGMLPDQAPQAGEG